MGLGWTSSCHRRFVSVCIDTYLTQILVSNGSRRTHIGHKTYIGFFLVAPLSRVFAPTIRDAVRTQCVAPLYLCWSRGLNRLHEGVRSNDQNICKHNVHSANNFSKCLVPIVKFNVTFAHAMQRNSSCYPILALLSRPRKKERRKSNRQGAEILLAVQTELHACVRYRQCRAAG